VCECEGKQIIVKQGKGAGKQWDVNDGIQQKLSCICKHIFSNGFLTLLWMIRRLAGEIEDFIESERAKIIIEKISIILS
jgi:hypothetical protein